MKRRDQRREGKVIGGRIDKSNGDENIEARDGEARQHQGREKKEIQNDVQPKQTRQGKANQGKTR